MSDRKLRLDEILVSEGLATDAQIEAALARQKIDGGRLGSQLLLGGDIDEAGLVKALAVQSGCRGVVLSGLDIADIILKLIPGPVALARKILPFDYDPEDNILRLACEDPTDNNLHDEIAFVARGKKIELYIAAELSLDQQLANSYPEAAKLAASQSRGLIGPTSGDELLESSASASGSTAVPGDSHDRRYILLVTDDEDTIPALRTLLECDQYSLVVTDSARGAIDEASERKFEAVLIKDTAPGDYLDLIDRLRKNSPGTRVRFYESTSSLLLNDSAAASGAALLLQNLELSSSMLAAREKKTHNHPGRVGHLTDRLCRKIGLGQRERMAIVTAAYLHDLSNLYYHVESDRDHRYVTDLSARLLRSIGFPPDVIGILRAAYKDLKGHFTERLPIETLGGNIITIVDLFCESFPHDQSLALDKLDALENKFRKLSGKLFLPEVIDAFAAMIKEDALATSAVPSGQLLVYANPRVNTDELERVLAGEGLRVAVDCSLENVTSLFARSKPDILMLVTVNETSAISALVHEFTSKGIDFNEVPTLLLIDGDLSGKLTDVMKTGVEDVLTLDGGLDMMILKLRRLTKRARKRTVQQVAPSNRSTAPASSQPA